MPDINRGWDRVSQSAAAPSEKTFTKDYGATIGLTAPSGPSPRCRVEGSLEAAIALTIRVRELASRALGEEPEEAPAPMAHIAEGGALGGLAVASEAALHHISSAHRALDRLFAALE